jgi:hypothetical protein
MTITGVTTGTSPFTRLTSGVPANCGTTLAVGATCTIRVRYVPTSATASTATVTVGGSGSTAPTPPVSATLTGTGDAPPLPGAPTNVNASQGFPGGQVTATLTWTAPAYAGSYQVQWSTSQATINTDGGAVISNISGSPYTFNGGSNGVASGTTVYFKVRAVNSTGNGNWSVAFSSNVR